MTDRFLADMDELNTFTKDLEGASQRVLVDSSKVLVKGILDVVADAQVFVPVDTGATRGSIHAAHAGTDTPIRAHDLTLDVEAGPTTEYAPELEYGAPGRDQPPRAFMGPAFDRNTPDVVKGLEIAATKRVIDP